MRKIKNKVLVKYKYRPDGCGSGGHIEKIETYNNAIVETSGDYLIVTEVTQESYTEGNRNPEIELSTIYELKNIIEYKTIN